MNKPMQEMSEKEFENFCYKYFNEKEKGPFRHSVEEYVHNPQNLSKSLKIFGQKTNIESKIITIRSMHLTLTNNVEYFTPEYKNVVSLVESHLSSDKIFDQEFRNSHPLYTIFQKNMVNFLLQLIVQYWDQDYSFIKWYLDHFYQLPIRAAYIKTRLLLKLPRYLSQCFYENMDNDILDKREIVQNIFNLLKGINLDAENNEKQIESIIEITILHFNSLGTLENQEDILSQLKDVLPYKYVPSLITKFIPFNDVEEDADQNIVDLFNFFVDNIIFVFADHVQYQYYLPIISVASELIESDVNNKLVRTFIRKTLDLIKLIIRRHPSMQFMSSDEQIKESLSDISWFLNHFIASSTKILPYFIDDVSDFIKVLSSDYYPIPFQLGGVKFDKTQLENRNDVICSWICYQLQNEGFSYLISFIDNIGIGVNQLYCISCLISNLDIQDPSNNEQLKITCMKYLNNAITAQINMEFDDKKAQICSGILYLMLVVHNKLLDESSSMHETLFLKIFDFLKSSNDILRLTALHCLNEFQGGISYNLLDKLVLMLPNLVTHFPNERQIQLYKAIVSHINYFALYNESENTKIMSLCNNVIDSLQKRYDNLCEYKRIFSEENKNYFTAFNHIFLISYNILVSEKNLERFGLFPKNKFMKQIFEDAKSLLHSHADIPINDFDGLFTTYCKFFIISLNFQNADDFNNIFQEIQFLNSQKGYSQYIMNILNNFNQLFIQSSSNRDINGYNIMCQKIFSMYMENLFSNDKYDFDNDYLNFIYSQPSFYFTMVDRFCDKIEEYITKSEPVDKLWHVLEKLSSILNSYYNYDSHPRIIELCCKIYGGEPDKQLLSQSKLLLVQLILSGTNPSLIIQYLIKHLGRKDSNFYENIMKFILEQYSLRQDDELLEYLLQFFFESEYQYVYTEESFKSYVLDCLRESSGYEEDIEEEVEEEEKKKNSIEDDFSITY